jgi:hypothetical protein
MASLADTNALLLYILSAASTLLIALTALWIVRGAYRMAMELLAFGARFCLWMWLYSSLRPWLMTHVGPLLLRGRDQLHSQPQARLGLALLVVLTLIAVLVRVLFYHQPTPNRSDVKRVDRWRATELLLAEVGFAVRFVVYFELMTWIDQPLRQLLRHWIEVLEQWTVLGGTIPTPAFVAAVPQNATNRVASFCVGSFCFGDVASVAL